MRIWNIKTNRLQATLRCPKVIELAKRQAEPAMRAHGQTHEYVPTPCAESAGFSPDGHAFAVAFGESAIPGKPRGVGVVQLWDAATGKPLAEITHNSDSDFVQQIAYAPDGSLLATAGRDGSVILWNAKTLKKVATVAGYAPIAFAPHGSQMVVTDRGPLLRQTTIRGGNLDHLARQADEHFEAGRCMPP